MTSDDPSSIEKTYKMGLSEEAHTTDYKFLEYYESQPETEKVNTACGEILAEWLNHQFDGLPRTRKEWEKEKTLAYTSTEAPEKTFSFRPSDFFRPKIAALRAAREWKAADLPIHESWIDAGIAMVADHHAPCNQNDTESLTFISNEHLDAELPRSVQLDREGVMFTSMLAHLEQTILKTRQDLIAESDAMLKIGKRDPSNPNLIIAVRPHQLKSFSVPWLSWLSTYITSLVSVVEITLYLLYYKAMFAPLPGWKFDLEVLGGPVNRRLPDKIAWVGAITGHGVGDLARGYHYLEKIKRVRNHLAHFDPAVFAFSIEDLADWINSCSEIARLMWIIRGKMDLPLSEGLVSLLLVKRVRHVPRDPTKRRPKQPDGFGYASCGWKAVLHGGQNSWFMVKFSKGLRWIPGNDLTAQSNWREHKLYWLRLINEKFLGAAIGELADEGIVLPQALIESTTIDHVKALVADDPMVRCKALSADVHPWGTRVDTLRR